MDSLLSRGYYSQPESLWSPVYESGLRDKEVSLPGTR